MDEATKKNSGHRVEVVELKLTKLPNSDFLSLATFEGWSCVCNSEDWEGKTLAAWVPPDSLVPVDRPEFSFLAKDAKDGMYRVRAERIRGALSFGLLVPAPDNAKVGDDVAEQLGVLHYNPPACGEGGKTGLYMGGEVAKAPTVYSVKYDVEAGRKYAQKVFEPGEPVVITEKLHGQSFKCVFEDGACHVSSRNEWKKEFPSFDHVTVESLVANGKVTEERANEIVSSLKSKPKRQNVFWQAFHATPGLKVLCEAHPGLVVHGEVLGGQDLRYGVPAGEVRFAAFDMMRSGRWLDFHEAYELASSAGIPWVPLLSSREGESFDFDKCCALAEGKTTFSGASHVREGCVVQALKERYHPEYGRCKLKFVGCGYLDRKEAAEPPEVEE